MKVLIADDEPRARSRMARLLAAHPDVTVVGEAGNGTEVVEQVFALRPDVVFLDIQMPGCSGLQAAEQLRDHLPESVRPALVFTTAFAEHAVQAFGLASLDYLLKPVEKDRLGETLRRVRERLWSRNPSAAPVVPPVPATAAASLTAHRGTALQAVEVGTLLYVEVEDGVTFAHTREGARHRLSESLAELDASLPSPAFARVSRSTVVAVACVERLVPKDSGTFDAVLVGGATVAVSRRRAKNLRDLMGM